MNKRLASIVRKGVILVVTLFFVSCAVFAAFHIIPGDPALLILGTEASEERLTLLREELGTDKGVLSQYVDWIGGMVHGNLGLSLTYRKPVMELLAARLPVTFMLGLMVLVLTLLVSLPLGIAAGYHKDGTLGRLAGVFSIAGISVPDFFLSIIVIWIFGLSLHLFAPGRYVGYAENFPAFLRFMIFPAITIALPQIAILTKYVRAAVAAELGAGYVRTARSKGCSSVRVLACHVFKNTLVSVMPLLGMIVGSIFSGSIIVEQVFGISGIGRLLISSVTSRDFPLTQGLVLYIAGIMVLVNFLVDIAVQFIDPRICFKD